MFESTAALLNAGELDPAFDPGWTEREPSPGEAGYAAYRAYEEQQIAFWNAYAASEASPDQRLNLNAARTDAGLLDAIARGKRRENAAAGETLRAIADYANRKIAEPNARYDEEYLRRSVEAEVGLALHVPPGTASALLHLALTLSRRLPQTFAALEDGELSQRAADLIADASADLNVAQCARLEDTVLPEAGSRSYRSLRAKVRREVEKLDAEAVRKRAEKAREDRCVYVKDGHDGMATLCLEVPAEVAHAIYAAINDRVLSNQTRLKNEAADAGLVLAARDERRIGAQRADTMVDLLAAGLGIDPWSPPVPESSFLTDEQIAHLNKGANTYTPSPAMKKAVRNRDKHCRFPGCRRPARHCDLDHSIPFVKVGGKLVGPGTVYFNLGCLCRFHHQIKAMPGWHLAQDRGRFIWTTPNGMRFIVHPPPGGDDGEPADLPRYDPHEPIPF